MKYWLKPSLLILTTVLVSASVNAQDAKDKVEKKTEKEIVIRKNGDKAEKMTIVVDGDNVTINGKPVSEFKNDNVIIYRRDAVPGMYAPRAMTIPRGGMKFFDEDGPMAFGGARSNKAMLGVAPATADGGAKVTEITKESGAEKAGLKKDDVITKVGDRKIEDADDLVDAISNYKPNDKVNITYKRNNKEATTSVVLNENKTRGFAFNMEDGDFKFNSPNLNADGFFNFNRKPKIGLQIQDVEEGKGVKVQDVDDDSPAAKAGLKEGDVITELNGKAVDGVDNVKTEIKDLKEGDVVKVKFTRNGSAQTADIKLPKKLKSADL